MLDACAHLSATTKGTFGSVRETLLHLFAAEEGYVRHVTGTSPTPRLKELTMFPGFDELRRRAERSGKEPITITEQGELSQILHLDGGSDAHARGLPVLLATSERVGAGVCHAKRDRKEQAR